MTDYELADSLTEKQITSILNTWSDDSDEMRAYKALIRLGDSPALAMASTLNAKKRNGGGTIQQLHYT